MDEMNIISKFMTGVLSKVVTSVIKRSVGYDIDITINSIKAVCNDGKVKLRIDIDGEMSQSDFKSLIMKQL